MTAPQAGGRPFPVLLTGLVDDAAVFPPGLAPMAAAVPAHRAHRVAWYADLVGPFVCPDRKLPELHEILAASGDRTPLEVTLVIPGGAADVRAALTTVAADPTVTLTAVEVGPGGTDLDAADAVQAARRTVTALDTQLPPGVRGVVEVPRGAATAPVLDMLAPTGYLPKFRTGGATAAAFPTEGELAGFLTACAARGLPLKCTAGLHHAVRHTATGTGLEHHGFLNVLLAVDVAVRGGSAEAVALVLGERDPAAVAEQVARLPEDRARRLRATFRSFGTCNITEPLDDLLALGLVAAGQQATQAGERVGDRVQVGGDVEAVQVQVVAGVADHDHVGVRGGPQEPLEEFGGTDTAGERDEHAAKDSRPASGAEDSDVGRGEVLPDAQDGVAGYAGSPRSS